MCSFPLESERSRSPLLLRFIQLENILPRLANINFILEQLHPIVAYLHSTADDIDAYFFGDLSDIFGSLLRTFVFALPGFEQHTSKPSLL